ncbi:MAG: LCP family protein [Clostridiales bacterium]|nr:LCP family protein [Clostridiales bacterium]
MKQKKQDTPEGNSKNLFSVYIRLVLIIIGCFSVFLIVGLFAYSWLSKGNVITPEPSLPVTDSNPSGTQVTESGTVITNPSADTPVKTNFLIAGTDAFNMLTDVILVGCFDSNAKTVSLVSIPRDTYTKMSEENVAKLQEAGKYVPPSGVMKMNAVHSYAGKESGMLFLENQIEELLGVPIDYNAEVSLDAFRNIVDAVGGIWMEVPAGGFYYEDPTPGQNLVISVPEGMQLLNGEMAEGVVRYRNTYPRGDLQRIEMQQAFMKLFFEQVLNKETIIQNAPSFASTIISYVQTNFTIADVPKYVKYIGDLTEGSFSTYTLPGTDSTINEASYFIMDEEETKKLVDEIFFKETPAPAEEGTDEEPQTPPEPTDIKKMRIQVLNGADIEGYAADVSEKLRGYGFNVINVGNYYGDKSAKTRIMVKTDGDYTELAKVFEESVVLADPGIDEKYDIVIILGSAG